MIRKVSYIAMGAALGAAITIGGPFALQLAAAQGVKAVWPSGGNFLLVELDHTREECACFAASILLKAGIYLKDVSNRFPGEGGYLRIAVRLPEENARLLHALRQSVHS